MVKVFKRVSAFREVAALGTEGAAFDSIGVGLHTLKPGESGTILQISADPVLKMHLLELGFVTGSPITFLMSTPFGDPYIYALRGTSIALRKREAMCIRVQT